MKCTTRGAVIIFIMMILTTTTLAIKENKVINIGFEERDNYSVNVLYHNYTNYSFYRGEISFDVYDLNETHYGNITYNGSLYHNKEDSFGLILGESYFLGEALNTVCYSKIVNKIMKCYYVNQIGEGNVDLYYVEQNMSKRNKITVNSFDKLKTNKETFNESIEVYENDTLITTMQVIGTRYGDRVMLSTFYFDMNNFSYIYDGFCYIRKNIDCFLALFEEKTLPILNESIPPDDDENDKINNGTQFDWGSGKPTNKNNTQENTTTNNETEVVVQEVEPQPVNIDEPVVEEANTESEDGGIPTWVYVVLLIFAGVVCLFLLLNLKDLGNNDKIQQEIEMNRKYNQDDSSEQN